MNNKLKSAINHVKQWPEGYLWIPVGILSIIGAKWFYYWQSGRSPQSEGGVGWVVDLAPRLLVCMLVVLLCSVFREAGGVWLSKEERFANPIYASVQSIIRFGMAILFAYVLLH